jgi:hypothetical protein
LKGRMRGIKTKKYALQLSAFFGLSIDKSTSV